MIERIRLTDHEVAKLRAEHPALPDAYWDYLRSEGWGETANGYLIFDEPVSVEKIFPHLAGDDRVLVVDDFEGYCLGFDRQTLSFGQYSYSGEWSEFDSGFDLAEHLSGRKA